MSVKHQSCAKGVPSATTAVNGPNHGTIQLVPYQATFAWVTMRQSRSS